MVFSMSVFSVMVFYTGSVLASNGISYLIVSKRYCLVVFPMVLSLLIYLLD